MRALFSNLLTASVSGSIVILAVLVLRLVLRKTPKKFICILWMVAGLRLLLPVPLQSRFSLQPPTIRLPQSETLQTYLVPLWCIVAVSLLCASLISYAHLRRQVKDARKIRGGWECEGLETAFVLGFLKPKIYIPAGVSDNHPAADSGPRAHPPGQGGPLDQAHWLSGPGAPLVQSPGVGQLHSAVQGH